MKVQTPRDFDRWVDIQRRQTFPLNVTAEAWKSSRSNEANAYLFGVAYPPLVDRTGYTPDEIHEHCLGVHFGWVDRKCPRTPRNPNGVESVPVRTTTKDENGKRSVLTRAEFSAFVDCVQRIAAEAGVFIPDAEQAA